MSVFGVGACGDGRIEERGLLSGRCLPGLALALALALARPAAAPAEGRLSAPSAGVWTEAFDDVAAASAWQARGARATVSGGVLSIEAAAGGSLAVGVPASAALVNGTRLVVRVRTAQPTALTFSFPVRARNARFWQTAEIAAGDWQDVALPLRYFRWNHPAVPTWEDIDGFEIALPRGGTVEIDRAAVEPGTTPRSAYLSVAEIAEIAFGPGWVGAVRRLERSPFVVLSDAPALDAATVMNALGRTYQRVRTELPSLHPPRRAVVLLVFATEPAYRAFWPRLLARFGHVKQGDSEAGMAAMGVAATWYGDPAHVLSVAVHEATHALTTQMLGLAGGASWLFEGIATRYDLDYAPYDVGARIRRALAAGFAPLERLVAGNPTPPEGYVPSALLVEWLLDDPLRERQLPALLAAMRERGSTDLRPLVERHLGLTLPALERAWRGWAESRWGGPG